MRHLLVTGGTGFVMAHVVRAWLLAGSGHRVTVLDISEPDAAARRFFEPVLDRITFVAGDVAEPSSYSNLPAVDAVVHGATITPHPYRDKAGALRAPEREEPARVIRTNIMGTTRLLDWARRMPAIERVVNISSGSVYARAVPETVAGALFVGEDQHVAPDGLYDITKLTGEMLAARFGTLFGLKAVSFRLSGVFGAMDRFTPARHVRCVPQVMAVNALAGRETRVLSTAASGDFVSAADVARAVLLALAEPEDALRHPVYNIAGGELVTYAELAAVIGAHTGGCVLKEVPADKAELSSPPDQRTGRFAAYDIARASRDFGWSPRPLSDTVGEYIDWLRAEASI
ncbi:MAG: NAD(P)-dependent oxidoreductase [Paracoccaceae bacterium]